MSLPTLSEELKSVVFEAAFVPLIFIVMLAAGRVLKRRYHVHLGALYKLFCAALAFYLPLAFSHAAFWWMPMLARHFGAVTLLFGVSFLIALIRRFFWEGWFERSQKTRAPKFISQIVALLIFIASVLIVVGGIYGQSIQGAVFGSTIVLGIIGFAMQDLLGNIIAGIALELGKPFRVGDWLVVDKQHAEVIEVNWRSTRLRTNDDVYLDIPNKQIVGATITNLTFPTRQHAIRLRVGFDHSVPPNYIKDVIGRAVAEARGVLATPKPKVFLNDFAESAVTYEIKFWMEDESSFWDIVDGIRTNVWYAAQRANIRMPFPIRTVHLERHGGKSTGTLATAQQSARKHPFLQLLDEEQMGKLIMHARLLRFGRGEKVIEQGGTGQSMFVLLHGEADVLVGANGSQTHVATLRTGDYCGEMSLLTGEPRSATVIARTDCEMWEIDKNTMGELLQENETLVQKLGEILAERRLMTEGIVASTTDRNEVRMKQEEYTQGFLKKLSAFFDL
ncbi:MAG TPA: mechanosensitive ion channel family protein [Chthoniobacteraceae bacterium]|nr:mechanosensitive ion channel family protein [Chthoniobacteraceae bacterium]